MPLCNAYKLYNNLKICTLHFAESIEFAVVCAWKILNSQNQVFFVFFTLASVNDVNYSIVFIAGTTPTNLSKIQNYA